MIIEKAASEVMVMMLLLPPVQSYKLYCESVKYTIIIIMIIQSPNRVLSEGSTKNPCRTPALGAVIAVIIIIVIVKALILSIKAIWFHHWFLASIPLLFTILPIFSFFPSFSLPLEKSVIIFSQEPKRKVNENLLSLQLSWLKAHFTQCCLNRLTIYTPLALFLNITECILYCSIPPNQTENLQWPSHYSHFLTFTSIYAHT